MFHSVPTTLLSGCRGQPLPAGAVSGADRIEVLGQCHADWLLQVLLSCYSSPSSPGFLLERRMSRVRK